MVVLFCLGFCLGLTCTPLDSLISFLYAFSCCYVCRMRSWHGNWLNWATGEVVKCWKEKNLKQENRQRKPVDCQKGANKSRVFRNQCAVVLFNIYVGYITWMLISCCRTLASSGKELKDGFMKALAQREEANRSGKMTVGAHAITFQFCYKPWMFALVEYTIIQHVVSVYHIYQRQKCERAGNIWIHWFCTSS